MSVIGCPSGWHERETLWIVLSEVVIINQSAKLIMELNTDVQVFHGITGHIVEQVCSICLVDPNTAAIFDVKGHWQVFGLSVDTDVIVELVQHVSCSVDELVIVHDIFIKVWLSRVDGSTSSKQRVGVVEDILGGVEVGILIVDSSTFCNGGSIDKVGLINVDLLVIQIAVINYIDGGTLLGKDVFEFGVCYFDLERSIIVNGDSWGLRDGKASLGFI